MKSKLKDHTPDLMDLPKSQGETYDTAVNMMNKDLSNFEKSCKKDNSKEPAFKCRYAVTLTAFIIQLFASSHRTLMSMVIVAMVNNTAVSQSSKVRSESCPELIMNSTEDIISHGLKSKGEFNWSPETQGYILGCLFFGHVVTQIPAGRLSERYGCKWILVGGLLTLSILTMLIPPFSRLSISAVIVLQILRGLLLGTPGPCVAVLMVNWSPKTERGLLSSIMQSGNALGPALGNVVAGYISESPAGWPYAFYFTGGTGLLFALYMSFFLAENPKEHPRISKAELNFILSQQECKLMRRRPKLPWSKILTSLPVYALIFVIFGSDWSSSQFWIVHSTFLGTILHYPIGENGLFSAIPFLVSFLTSIVASWVSGSLEKSGTASVNFLRKFWILMSSLLYSACLFGMYLAGCNRDLSVTFSILSMGSKGLGTPGFFIVMQDMSPTFAGTLDSITSTCGYCAGVILPLIVGYLTEEKQTLEQWNKVFFISIGVIMSSAVAFAIFGSAKIQPWNFADKSDEENNKKKHQNINEKHKMTRL